MVVISWISLIASLAEASVLILVVNTALSLTDASSDAVDLSLPWVGRHRFSPTALLVIAAMATLVSLAGHVAVASLSARLSAAVLRRSRTRAAAAYAGALWHRQAAEKEGGVQVTVATLCQQSAQLALQYASMVSALTALVVLLIAAAFVDGAVTAIVIVFGLGLFLGLRPITSASRRRSRRFVLSNNHFSEQVSAWASMAMDLRVFGTERSELRRIDQLNLDNAQDFRKSKYSIHVGTTLYKDVALMFLVAAVAALHLRGSTDIAAIGAVVLLVVRSLSYATQVQASVQTISEIAPSLDSMLERIESLEAASEASGRRMIETIGSISVLDASYDYPGNRVGVAGLDFDLDPGDALGVIGPSGSGKSTLVQMLLGLRRPTSGAIEVSEIPYQDIDPRCWARLVSLVPQEPFLFEATITENIQFMRDWITVDQVRRAAEDAHVLDDIEALPDGFSTQLGPRGSGLSGGQKQRVAIARALAGDPQLLVLDEPTSALDVRSEELLKQTISGLKGSVTLVIIAHRLSTLEVCDRVLVLDAGSPQLIGPLEEALVAAKFSGGSGALLDIAE